MVFKRRDRRGWLAWVREMFYPTGGFRRATQYVIHRMRRLPDRPHRIARGVFAGSLIGFLPLPGLQFLGAWGLALVMRGNVLAALLATFNSNPITTPFFAVGAITLGHWMLGIDTPLNAEAIGDGFGRAGSELWHNFLAIFGPERMHWDGLAQFWSDIYLPYFIGALGPGILLSLIAYYITIPLVEAYQKARAAKFKERSDKRSLLREKLAALTLRGDAAKDPVTGTKLGDDETPPAS
ncbi:MAG: DUF2062 domain-containing protein [Paracoccaceae bacterium]